MNAAELATALGATGTPRRSARGLTHRVRCPAHEDRHPSLDVTDAGGTTLVVCRAGCTQREVIAALIGRGLWAAPSGAVNRTTPAFCWEERLTPEPPQIPPCCLRGPEHELSACPHWRHFEADMTVAHLRWRLFEAASEVVELYRVAGCPLTAEDLWRELFLASQCIDGDAIADPVEIDEVVARVRMQQEMAG